MKKPLKLPDTFFERKTLKVAEDLVGKVLVRKIGQKIIRERITEVEAYIGPQDLACHASRGRTPRTEVMHEEAGTIYIYLIYGMYYMLNIVTEDVDFPSAVLIRGTENMNGPGRVTKKLKITKTLNGKKLGIRSGLWIEEGPKILKKDIEKTPRIGIDYSGEWKDKLFRFVLKTSNTKLKTKKE